MASRKDWTDERLDDLKGHMDEHFRQQREEITLMAQQKEMVARFDAVDKRFDAVDKRFDDVIHMMQIGFGVIGVILTLITTMLAGAIGLLATQL